MLLWSMYFASYCMIYFGTATHRMIWYAGNRVPAKGEWHSCTNEAQVDSQDCGSLGKQHDKLYGIYTILFKPL